MKLGFKRWPRQKLRPRQVRILEEQRQKLTAKILAQTP